MKLFLLFLLLFTSLLKANDVSLNDKLPIYKSIDISADIRNIDDAIANPEKFKTHNYFRRYLAVKKIDFSSWFRLELNNSSSRVLQREVFTKWHHANIDIYLVENTNVIFKDNLTKHKNFQLSKPFTIEPKKKLYLYLHVKVEEGIDDFLYLYIASPDNIPNLISSKEVFNNGIFLGLILAMMFYNFFMSITLDIKSYFYLGLYQLMIVIYVSNARYYLITLLGDFPELSYFLFRAIPLLFATILLIIFTKEFLNTKENMPFINKLLNISIIIYICLQPIGTNNSSSVNYLSFLYILLIVAGFSSLRQGNKFALYYILGFSPTVICNFYINISRYLNLNIDIAFQNYIQILAVIEAFSLSMALYLKLKQSIEEKNRVEEEILKKEKIMLRQSKFATMGEMIENIVHQWRQPLNNISSILVNISFRNECDKLDKEFIKDKIEESNKQLQHMSKTIEDFRNFFRSKNNEVSFSVIEACNEAISLMETSFTNNQIEIRKKYEADFLIKGYSGEFVQVLLVLLSNAKDAFNQKQKNYKKNICITIDKNIIIVEDNAGGISKNIIDKIFDPYFSTKNKMAGTGLGLYISKIIIEERCKGTLRVENTEKGANFTIKF